MRRLVVSLALLASGTAVVGSSQPAAAGAVNKVVTVQTVVDGDTFEYLEGGSPQRVRLAGVNTNELFQSPKCNVDEATDRLSSLIAGKQVTLRADDSGSQAGGREYRHVFVSGRNVGVAMLEDGLGVPLILAIEPDYTKDYLTAAAEARDQGLGLFNSSSCGTGPSQSAQIELVVNGEADWNGSVDPNGEYVRVRNSSSSPLSLTGWSLTDTALESYAFPNGTVVPANGLVTVFAGSGTNTSTTKYMGNSGYIYSSVADGVFLLDPDNDIRASQMWPCIGLCGDAAVPNLVIDEVSFDPPGNDDLNPNGEFVRVRNAGSVTVDFQDWEVGSWPHQVRSARSRPLAPGATVTVFVGQGTETGSSIFFNKTSSILNTAGDIVVLSTPAGDIADCFAYGDQSCAATPAKTLARNGQPDFNGDGRADVLIGAPGEDIGSISNAGAVSVQRTAGPALQLTSGQQNRILTEVSRTTMSQSGPVPGASETGDQMGSAIGIGDFDGDGYADAVVGLPGENSSAGSAVVFSGGRTGLTASDTDAFSQSGSIAGAPEAGDRFGEAIAAGDFDGDGFDDIVVGVPGENGKSGLINVVYGGPSGLSIAGNITISQSGPVPGSSEAGDAFGAALAAGDINGDGFDDVAVGTPGEDFSGIANAGAVTVIFGGAGGLNATGSQWISQAGPVPGTVEANDRFGSVLAIGNLNADRFDDLVVGVPDEAIGSSQKVGIAIVIAGSSSSANINDSVSFRQSQPMGGGGESTDEFGSALAIGDFDGDGFGDIAVGVPGEGVGSLGDAGIVQVAYGSSNISGFASARNATFSQAGAVPGAVEAGDRFGSSLRAIEINGDGRSDLVIGAPGERLSGQNDAGTSCVLYGTGSGVTASGSFSLSQWQFGGGVESGDLFAAAL